MRKLWEESKPLTVTGIAMLVALILSLIAWGLDWREIAGAPAWLKPVKFAISTALYSLTLAWVFSWLPAWPRMKRWVGWITAVVMFVEVGLIDLQAARGVTSHFNVGTALDATIFAVMGISILVAWIASVAVVVALFRQSFADGSMGWALRIGMLLTVMGASVGGMMTRPTHAQLAEAHAGHGLPVSGAHTIGGVDGGAGMPLTKWSREHGDLRVPHFFGLHAIQILPLFAWLFARRRPGLTLAVGVGYAGVFVLLLAQALTGKPFLGGVL